MKIIDEKGKLFGKLNVIDLLVVLLVIALAAVLVQRTLDRSKDDESSKSNYTLTFQTMIKGVNPVYYDTIQKYVNPGTGLTDQLVSNNKLIDGYVLDCVAVPHESYVTTSDGTVKLVQGGEDDRLDLTFTLQAQTDDPVTNMVGTQQVHVGSPYVIKTAHFELSSTYIVDLDMEQNQ